MPYVVDTIEVEPHCLASYLDALEHFGLPVMTEAGASFVSCATTSAEIGENVHVQIVWAFEDHSHWNEIRKNLVLDPRWYDYADRLAALRRDGTRRFYYSVDFSPT
jgi:hypothetical protein